MGLQPVEHRRQRVVRGDDLERGLLLTTQLQRRGDLLGGLLGAGKRTDDQRQPRTTLGGQLMGQPATDAARLFAAIFTQFAAGVRRAGLGLTVTHDQYTHDILLKR